MHGSAFVGDIEQALRDLVETMREVLGQGAKSDPQQRLTDLSILDVSRDIQVGLEILDLPSRVRRFNAPIPGQMNSLRLDILNHLRVS